jgi:NADPH-dependent 2,4-dienoyl-CoA reductase/sulfur reductase-like enzyme
MPADASNHRFFDVLIVGAGPAGMAATVAASGDGRRIGLVDDNPDLGGQIWRGERKKASSKEASRLILATGARELFLPFPGWTLPNVMGAGGLQALVKSGLPIAGKSVVVAGSGPLLLAVAAHLKQKGAIVRGIFEQAPLNKLVRFGLGLWSEPSKIRQAIDFRWQLGTVGYKAGAWPVEAFGDEALRSVKLTNGRSTWNVDCDYLACGFGLVPNLELPAILGCEIGKGGTIVDEWQQTTISNVYCAGEATGIGGLELSLFEGKIAGQVAAKGRSTIVRSLWNDRDQARKFARSLDSSFALRDELRHLARPDTIVCRCEDVSAGALEGRTSRVDAKLQTRCGMGPCQGRICGAATSFLHGWERGSIRPPIFPVGVDNLAETCVSPVIGPV